jgi:quercetin dioxygenase-like cupin family protein
MKEKPDVPDRRKLLRTGSAAMLTPMLSPLLAQLAAGDALAQDAARTNPAAYRVVFENDKARVLEFVSRPGTPVCGIGKHSHPAHLTIALSDAKVRVTLADGKTIEASNVLGDVFWSEAETHSVENISGSNVRALIVEIKSPAAKA